MVKNKSKKNKKNRKKEVLKAQAKSSLRVLDKEVLKAMESIDVKLVDNKRSSQKLDIVSIRTDLIKTLIYLIVVVGFLIYIRQQGLTFNILNL